MDRGNCVHTNRLLTLMTLYQIEDDTLRPLDRTGFQREGLMERNDLQRLIRDQIEILDDALLVLAEEFGDWEDSRRRIDLLCLDRDANLVIVELKRTKRGGHMELQALRYAAMVSEMTFEQAVTAHTAYLANRATEDTTATQEDAAEQAILEHLGWSEADEDTFNQDVRIVLASQNFSSELTGAVLWLLERDIDIRCVRLRPYRQAEGPLILDVQQIIPLPEAADYQIRVREKRQVERASRTRQTRARIIIEIGGQPLEFSRKRRIALELFRILIERGMTPEQISEAVHWRKHNGMWASQPGKLDGEAFLAALRAKAETDNRRRDPRHYWFWQDDELIHHNGATYAGTKRWGPRTQEALHLVLSAATDQLGKEAVGDIKIITPDSATTPAMQQGILNAPTQ